VRLRAPPVLPRIRGGGVGEIPMPSSLQLLHPIVVRGPREDCLYSDKKWDESGGGEGN
jgi:hypothetical protein